MLFVDFCVSVSVVLAALHSNRDTLWPFVCKTRAYLLPYIQEAGFFCGLAPFCLTSFVCSHWLCGPVSSKSCRKMASMTQIVLVWNMLDIAYAVVCGQDSFSFQCVLKLFILHTSDTRITKLTDKKVQRFQISSLPAQRKQNLYVIFSVLLFLFF